MQTVAEAKRKAAESAAKNSAELAAARPPSSGLPVGAPAPPFSAITLDGRPFHTQQLKGKWVLLDFWATWCGPCKAEMPYIRTAYEAFGKDKR
ncbi:TlpA family protein disulfide reductase, partial [Tannerella forsythia]